jgi:hypothetical protein
MRSSGIRREPGISSPDPDEKHERVGRERQQIGDEGSEVLVPVGEELRELVEAGNQRRNDEPEVEEVLPDDKSSSPEREATVLPPALPRSRM